MNLARISELKRLIDSLYGTLRTLKERKANLENEYPGTANAQSRLDAAAVAAKNRLAPLAAFGMRADFLEEIISPIRNTPDCSGIQTTVKNEIDRAEGSINETNGRIGAANQEKQQLETEEV